MAKTTNEGSWEAVKNTKGAKKTAKGSPTISKSPVKSVSKAAPKAENKPEKKKAKQPVKQPFTLKDEDVGNIGGSAKGIVANMNALNFLTAEFSAPERIPPYDKDGPEFPASRLSPKAKARIENILSSLTESDTHQFLNVLVNNLISASRQGENAWGARVMGQLLMKKYPTLASTNTKDFLQTETHPGAVLSVLWLFSQVKNLDSLMCNLFQHVLPRLKQKRVAEYLPKILGDIELAMKAGGAAIKFRKAHIVAVVHTFTDSKLPKPVTTQLLTFFNQIQSVLSPNHEWIKSFIIILDGAERQQYSLPIILAAIEADPAKAAQELRHLSEDYRLQTDLILQSCPETTLNKKYRDIIESKLTEPIMSKNGKRASAQVNHPKKSKRATNGVKLSDPNQSGRSIFSYLNSLMKLVFVLGLVTAVSSKLDCTRPYYQNYAEPHINQYLQPAIEKATETIMPKYEEYVKPNVDLYVIPVFNKYVVPTYVKHVEPLVDSALVLWQKQISPVISEKLGQIQTVYDENLAPKVAELWENTKPKLINAYDLAIVYANQVQIFAVENVIWIKSKSAELTNGWEEKVEAFIVDARSYVAVMGIETRRIIDIAVVKFNEYSKEGLTMLQEGTVDGQQKAIEFYGIAKEKSLEWLEMGLQKSKELFVILVDTTGTYYEKIMDATVDQRAIISAKSQIAFVWLAAKGSELVDLLNQYEIGFYLESAFEGLGYTMLWIGDAMTELIGMRTCCLKARFRKLGNSIHTLGNDIYAKAIGK